MEEIKEWASLKSGESLNSGEVRYFSRPASSSDASAKAGAGDAGTGSGGAAIEETADLAVDPEDWVESVAGVANILR